MSTSGKYFLMLIMLCGFSPAPPANSFVSPGYQDLSAQIVPGDCSNPATGKKAIDFDMAQRKSFDTYRNVEISKCFPIPQQIDNKYTPIYLVNLKNIKAGQVLHVNYQTQLTSEIHLPTMVDTFVWIKQKGSGVYSTPSIGSNILFDEHHHAITGSVTYEFKNDGDYEIGLWVFGAIGPFPMIKNANVVIEPSSGHLQGFIL